MTDHEILDAARKIVRRALDSDAKRADVEREVLRDTITGLLWVQADLMIAAAR